MFAFIHSKVDLQKHVDFPCLKILFLPSLNDLHCKVPLNLESLNQTQVTSLALELRVLTPLVLDLLHELHHETKTLVDCCEELLQHFST